jgi:hypothetical protein
MALELGIEDGEEGLDCPFCGRRYEMDEELKVGGECPALSCPSHDITLGATVTITYNPMGVSKKELQSRLATAIRYMFGEGLITGETNAEVDDWTYSIEEL